MPAETHALTDTFIAPTPISPPKPWGDLSVGEEAHTPLDQRRHVFILLAPNERDQIPKNIFDTHAAATEAAREQGVPRSIWHEYDTGRWFAYREGELYPWVILRRSLKSIGDPYEA